MNSLLAELHRRYRLTGVPRLEQQQMDLVQIAHATRLDEIDCALRAVRGYWRARRIERAPVRSIWDLVIGNPGTRSR